MSEYVHHADLPELAHTHAELACVRSWRARAQATVPTWRPCPIVAQRPAHTCTRRAWSRACDARGLVSGCWPRVQVRAQKSPVECGSGLTRVPTLRYSVANAPKPHCADFSRVAGVRGRAGRENRRYRPKVLRDARYAARLPPLMVPGEPTACPYAALWLAQSRPGRLAGCG